MKLYFLKYKFFAQNLLPALSSVTVTPNVWKCWVNNPIFIFMYLKAYFYRIFVQIQFIRFSTIETFLHYFAFFNLRPSLKQQVRQSKLTMGLYSWIQNSLLAPIWETLLRAGIKIPETLWATGQSPSPLLMKYSTIFFSHCFLVFSLHSVIILNLNILLIKHPNARAQPS